MRMMMRDKALAETVESSSTSVCPGFSRRAGRIYCTVPLLSRIPQSSVHHVVFGSPSQPLVRASCGEGHRLGRRVYRKGCSSPLVPNGDGASSGRRSCFASPVHRRHSEHDVHSDDGDRLPSKMSWASARVVDHGALLAHILSTETWTLSFIDTQAYPPCPSGFG